MPREDLRKIWLCSFNEDPEACLAPGGVLHGFKAFDYESDEEDSERGARLSLELGIEPEDGYLYALGHLPDGRYALVGPMHWGERFALEAGTSRPDGVTLIDERGHHAQ